MTALVDVGVRPDVTDSMPAALPAALASANRLLDARTSARRDVIARQADADRSTELARASAYYDEMLASLRRRRENAPPDRQASFDARADAVRAEHARRIAEIDEAFRPQTDLHLFRLHVVWVPSLAVPAHVLRGPRRYALELAWLSPAASFLPASCPHCGDAGVLVAGKERLGCRTCLPAAALVVVPRRRRPVRRTPRPRARSRLPRCPPRRRLPHRPHDLRRAAAAAGGAGAPEAGGAAPGFPPSTRLGTDHRGQAVGEDR